MGKTPPIHPPEENFWQSTPRKTEKIEKYLVLSAQKFQKLGCQGNSTPKKPVFWTIQEENPEKKLKPKFQEGAS